MTDTILTPLARFRKALGGKIGAADITKAGADEYKIAEAALIEDWIVRGSLGDITATDQYGPGQTLGLKTSVFWTIPAGDEDKGLPSKQREAQEVLTALGLGYLVELTIADNRMAALLYKETKSDHPTVFRNELGFIATAEFFSLNFDSGDPIAVNEIFLDAHVDNAALRKALNEELSNDDGIVSRDADGKMVVPLEFFDSEGGPVIRFHETHAVSVNVNSK